jgi:hypothetical protein
MVEGAPTMANHISPAAQLFRGMAELIDHDHTSQTHYEAVTKAAAFQIGLPRQATTASQVQALVATNPAPPQGGHDAPPDDPTRSPQVLLRVGPPGRRRPPA